MSLVKAMESGRTLVLGAGTSGLAAARLLLSRGRDVVVADQSPSPAVPERQFVAAGAALTRGDPLPSGKFALCVASPGIAAGHPWLVEMRRRGVPVISETFLAGWHWSGRALAVSGSKGKSSVVKLCAEALCRSGMTAAPCGNYGRPWSAVALDEPDLSWAVVEVSSFQLELAPVPCFNRALLLNIMPDHLDRHGDFATYKRLKMRLFSGQRPGDAAFLPAGLRWAGQCPGNAPRRWRFGVGPGAHWRYLPGMVREHKAGSGREVDMSGSWFDNPIRGPAAAGAVGALFASGATASAITSSLRDFSPLPHRWQPVGQIRGVGFVNDSKATSMTALAAAVSLVPGQVLLIAGGRLKEKNLNEIGEKLASRVRKVYLIGEGTGAMAEAWRPTLPCLDCGNMAGAVAAAWRDARPGDTVLLAPGAASFDQYENFQKRGEDFVRLVNALLT